MQKYKIVILETAEKAIRDNYDYITQVYENEPAAIAHTIDIYKKVKSLEIFPKAYGIYEGFSGKEFRVAHVRHYRIFYRVDEDKHIVYIERIYHAKQDADEF